MPVSAGLRPLSPRARSPTRLAKFSSAPGDFARQRSVLDRYEAPPPLRARTDLGFSPVTDAGEAPYHPPLRTRTTAGPSVFSPVSAYTDDSPYYGPVAHGASGRCCDSTLSSSGLHDLQGLSVILALPEYHCCDTGHPLIQPVLMMADS